MADPDSSIGAGLRQRNQAERQSTGTYHRDAMLGFCEKETKKLMQRELPVDVSALAGGRAGGAGDPVLARVLLCRREKPRGAGAASGGGRLPPRRLCAGGSRPPPAASSGDTRSRRWSPSPPPFPPHCPAPMRAGGDTGPCSQALASLGTAKPSPGERLCEPAGLLWHTGRRGGGGRSAREPGSVWLRSHWGGQCAF